MELKELSWANAKLELGVAFTFLTKTWFIDKKTAKTLADSEIIRIFAPTKPVHSRAGQDIDGILRPTMPFVGQAKVKTFTDVIILCCLTLQLRIVHKGNATERLRG